MLRLKYCAPFPLLFYSDRKRTYLDGKLLKMYSSTCLREEEAKTKNEVRSKRDGILECCPTEKPVILQLSATYDYEYYVVPHIVSFVICIPKDSLMCVCLVLVVFL